MPQLRDQEQNSSQLWCSDRRVLLIPDSAWHYVGRVESLRAAIRTVNPSFAGGLRCRMRAFERDDAACFGLQRLHRREAPSLDGIWTMGMAASPREHRRAREGRLTGSVPSS